MNRQRESFTTPVIGTPLRRGGVVPLILLACLAGTANGQSQVETPAAGSLIHVKHVLGFESVRRNASGELSIQGEDLSFQQNEKPAGQVSITSIHNIAIGNEDNQVGGVPMMLGKTAVPFGGGRVVSLFSHKKYDSLAVEYLDSNGGFHGAIFRLAKGRGKTVKSDLISRGARLTPSEEPGTIRTSAGQSPKAAEKWSVQVDRIDPGATTLDPSFSDAIYENMLVELPKSKQFKRVFRSGDRNADDDSGVLVLKTLVEKYSPGSETKRAVTTVAGATKLKVDIQLVTRDGHLVLEHVVDGNVRFLGDNLHATNKVAHNTAKFLKQSPLPQPATPITQQSTVKEPTSIPMSFTSQSPLAANILLLLESGLRDQPRELARAIERGQKEIHALADSGPGDVIDDSFGNACKENMFASYCQNRTGLGKVELTLKRISTGVFGICAACGDTIGLKRLQALPWANKYIECQEQSEQGRVN